MSVAASILFRCDTCSNANIVGSLRGVVCEWHAQMVAIPDGPYVECSRQKNKPSIDKLVNLHHEECGMSEPWNRRHICTITTGWSRRYEWPQGGPGWHHRLELICRTDASWHTSWTVWMKHWNSALMFGNPLHTTVSRGSRTINYGWWSVSLMCRGLCTIVISTTPPMSRNGDKATEKNGNKHTSHCPARLQ